MSKVAKKRGLHVKGKQRITDLVQYMTGLGARGMRRVQIRAVAETYNETALSPPLGDDEFNAALAEASKRLKEEKKQEHFKDLHTVEKRKAEFLIYPYLPKGAVTILDGNPGMGKSLVTTHLAAAVSTGGRFAKGEKVPQGRVVFLSPEDEADRILGPRLEAHGADITQIRFMFDPFLLTSHGVELLRKELIAHPPALVIVDPLSAFVGTEINTSQANEVRGFMRPLAMLASEFDISVMIVRHMRKAASDTAIQMGQGSMDFIASVRSGLIVAGHPNDRDTRVFAHAKANWSAKGRTMTFELKGGGRDSVPTIDWLATIDMTADELVAGKAKQKAEEAAAAMIAELLVTGPMEAKKAIDRLKQEGFRERTIDRAKVIAKVVSGRGPNAEWKLR